jgi:transposase
VHEDDEKRYSSDFKATVALAAIRWEMTASQLGAKHGIHPTVIGGWKRQAMEGLESLFVVGDPAAKAMGEAEIEKLDANIGQLLVKRDFFSEGLRSMTVEQRQKTG